MTDPAPFKPTLLPSTLQLYDHVRPGLDADTYTIEAEHTLEKADGTTIGVIPSAKRTFTVAGPRFAFEPGEIHAVYPPENAKGPYAETLPHVVLSTRTLPWERALADQEETVPWLALLVLDSAELSGTGSASPTGALTTTVDALLSGGDDVHVPDLEVSDAEGKLTCQTLQIPATLFAAVAPRLSELTYLAHVRLIDASGQPGAAAGEAGWFALVVANRLPVSEAGGVKNVAHLVSLEGHEALLAAHADSPEEDGHVRLVSLASWSFWSTPDTDDAGESFGRLANNLAKAQPGDRDDLTLGLPFDEDATGNGASKLPATDPRRQVAERLADGYVPVTYHVPTGEETFAWYRGPLTPRQTALIHKPAPFPASSAAMVYDEATGLFDVSLATAWELGRALALADRKFTLELVRFRRGVHRLVDLVLAGLQSAHLDTPDDLAAIAKNGLIEQRFLERLQDDLVGHVAAMSGGGPAPPAQPAPADAELPRDPVLAVKALLERENLQTLVAKEVAELEPIAEWLARLSLLQGAPFAYLVAHPQLLPVESARFFTVDQNWIGALVDGALSVGAQSSRDSWFQKLVQPIVPDAVRAVTQRQRGLKGDDRPGATVSGLLVRSALVAGWPGLTVEATESSKSSALLRSDRLAPNVLLCLFAGVPDEVRLRVPHQSLHFALESGHVYLRRLDAPLGEPNGQSVNVGGDPTLWRMGAKRVLNIAAPDGAGDPGLVSRIAGKLGSKPGPADFALQMLSAPEELRFTRS
jgi:hypothetical protein